MGRKESKKKKGGGEYSPKRKRTDVAATGHLGKTPGKRADLPPQLQENKPHFFPKAMCATRGHSAASGSAEREKEGTP